MRSVTNKSATPTSTVLLAGTAAGALALGLLAVTDGSESTVHADLVGAAQETPSGWAGENGGTTDGEGGDVVTVFGRDGGQELSVTEMAERAGVFAPGVFCNLNARVTRLFYLGGELVDSEVPMSRW